MTSESSTQMGATTEPRLEDEVAMAASGQQDELAMPSRPRVVVLGGGVAGVTAAYELRRQLGALATITLVSNQERFTLGLALVGVPFARRPPRVGFALAPALKQRGVDFVHARVDRVEPERKILHAEGREIPYEYLVIATGPRVEDIAASGMQAAALLAIHTEPAALATRAAMEGFLARPGPVVVGLARGAGYLSAAYEFVLQLDYALRRQGTRERATIAFVTPEVHLGYLGTGVRGAQRALERTFARRRITVFTGAVIDHVDDGWVYLHEGTRLPASLALILPRLEGTPAILQSAGLTDEFGFVPVDAQYRHQTYPEIYAAGVAARLQFSANPPGALPKTGYLAAAAGATVAANLAAAIQGSTPTARTLPRLLDLRILDGGDTGLLLASAGAPLPFRIAVPLPGRTAHWAKELLVRYLLWKLRTGRTNLP